MHCAPWKKCEHNNSDAMKRVTGIGGIFFKSKDPEQLRDWYRKHLGIESESWGGFSFSEFGKFGWIMDPDGNRVELWEPPTIAK